MPGWLTNGMPLVEAKTTNTTVNTPENGLVTQVTPAMLLPVDSELTAGQPNQSVAASAWHVAAAGLGLITNSGTSTAAAATLNTASGYVTTEALTTAAGATYAFTLTNSTLSTSVPAPLVHAGFATCTAGAPEVTSVVNGSGNTVITITNIGTAAFNGKLNIAFQNPNSY